MYRTCIFCSARLGSNDVIERFPIGRTLAFDAAKGRLWAVCPKCARWNLAPIEERWEAIDDAEKLFRDARVRAQSENIGIARLRDGTRLVRIGAALTGEVAVWRYGRRMRRLWVQRHYGKLALTLSPLAIFAAGGPMLATGVFLGLFAYSEYRELTSLSRAGGIAHRIGAGDSPGGRAFNIRWWEFSLMRMAVDENGAAVVHMDQSRYMLPTPMVLSGPVGAVLIRKALSRINEAGARPPAVAGALGALSRAGGGQALLRRVADERPGLGIPGMGEHTGLGIPGLGFGNHPVAPPLASDPGVALAVEMAVNEETERRAIEGEMAALEAMWREAEGIAAIADRLPDDVPPSDPPRLNG